MKPLITLLTIFALLIFVSSWFVLPEPMSRLLLNINNTSAGLSAKTLKTSIGDIQYLEGGQGETIVLLHGIYARKEHWVELSRSLTGQFHVIILDLPGFGDNMRRDANEYRLTVQASNLDVVLQTLKIESAHFGANSMGAQVAGLLALESPKMIKTLAFIGSPLGVPSPIKSDMENALADGNIPLQVKTESDFIERNEWLFPNEPSIPSPIMKTWMRKELIDTVKNEQIWHAVNNFTNIPYLIDIAPSLHMPTLIIWCQEDRIFHVSGANVLHDALPNSSAEILKNCGHVPMLDKPTEVAKAYLSFLNRP